MSEEEKNRYMSELKLNKFMKNLAGRAFEETVGSKDHNKVKKSFAERFAELMVEACGTALDTSNPEPISRSEAYELIKKRFTS